MGKKRSSKKDALKAGARSRKKPTRAEAARARKLEQIRMLFGSNVAILRQRMELTQGELADKLGIHRVTVNRIEAGIHVPGYDEACLMADILGVSIAAMRNDLQQADLTGQ